MSSQQFLSYTEYLHVIYVNNVDNWTVCAESYVHWQEGIPVGCVPPAWKLYMLKWPPPDVTSGGLSSEHVWTGLQYWPPDVAPMGVGSSSEYVWIGIQCWPRDVCWAVGPGGSRSDVGGLGMGLGRSQVSCPGDRGSLYSQVQSIMGNGPMGTPCGQTEWQTHTTENITFTQLRWWAVIMQKTLKQTFLIYRRTICKHQRIWKISI